MSEHVTVAAGPDGRPVARKVGSTPERADLLRHEASLLGAARHPAVVELVGVEDDGTGVTVTTAWAGGRRLSDLGRPPVEEAAGLAAALATALADLHDLGIVHGRVQADHVLVAAGGRPVLCGWSGGGRAGDVPHPSATPPSAPDPARPWGSPLAPAADVHGLGLVLHGLLGTDDGVEPIPDRRFGRRRSGWRGYQRRSLQTLADQAAADDPAHRPAARGLASAIRAAVPGARLPAGPPIPSGEPRRPFLVGAVRAGDPDDPSVALPPGAMGPGAAPAAPPAPAPGSPPPGDPDQPAAAGAPGHPPIALPRLTGRGVAAAAAAVVGLALLAGGGRLLLGGPPSDPQLTTASSPAPPDPAPPAPHRTTCDDPAPPPPAAGPVADVDGDGCGRPVQVSGGVVEAEDVRFAVGDPGDRVLVGDWDCDGQATPAVVRPSTGELFVFPSWAPDGDVLTVQPVATVPTGAVPEAVDGDGDGCHAVTVETRDGEVVTWPEGEA